MFIDCGERIAGNRPHTGHGVTVTDIDGDGVFEFLVSGTGMANRVLKWDGGRLVDIADSTLADSAALTTCLIAGDIDGDGREEIYACSQEHDPGEGQADRLFAPFGAHWHDLFSRPENAEVAENATGQVVACLDRTGRGRYGFAVGSAGDPLALYELDSRGRLINTAEDAGLDVAVDARALVALALVSDRMDLFVHVDGGANCLFRNLGDGSFEEVATRRGLADPRQRGRGLAIVDAGGSGLLDLLCGVWHGSHRLFLQRAGGGFSEEAPAEMSLPSHTNSVIAADFDNDGFPELLFLNHGQPNRLFAMRHEEWTAIDVGDAAEPRGLSTGAAVADIDSDGLLELLVNHGGGHQPLSLYKAAPNPNGWLRIQPLTAAGAPARGALVTCTGGGRVQRRVICAGSGYLSQMEPVAHFGLGAIRRAERIEIRWPDGAEAVIHSVPVNRVITVPHPPE